MRTTLQGWLVVGLLLGTMAYAIAEEFTLTTYYPSPRGVYNELRVGSPNVTAPLAKLHVVGDGTSLPFKVEDSPSDGTPFVITGSGDVGIGMNSPSAKLDVAGSANISQAAAIGANATIGGTATIGGDTTVGGNLSVAGTMTGGNLTVNGNAVITGTITVQGGGSPDVGKVLTSDGTGQARWEYPTYAP